MRRCLVGLFAATLLGVAPHGASRAQDGETPPPESAPAVEPPPEILAKRRRPSRNRSVRVAIEAGLEWLVRHQEEDGRWRPDSFHQQCKHGTCSGPGEEAFTPGVTGLALLALLGAGNTHLEGPHADSVARAIAYLRRVQDSEGAFGSRTHSNYQHNQAPAACAIGEAYWLSRDEELREPSERALGFLRAARNPYLGWRYGERNGENDTAMTAWMTTALHTLELAGLDVPSEDYEGAENWLEKMTEPTRGRVGYQTRGGPSSRFGKVRMLETGWPPPLPKEIPIGGYTRDEPPFAADGNESYARDGVETLTAMGAFARVLATGDAKRVKLSAALLAGRALDPKAPGETQDLHLHVFGNLLFEQLRTQSVWRKNSAKILVAAQRPQKDAEQHGSWDASLDPWGMAGGRVYTTAMALLSLQSPTRFPRVKKRRSKAK